MGVAKSEWGLAGNLVSFTQTVSSSNINVSISFCHHKPTCVQTNMIFINGIFDFDIFVNCQLTMKYYNEISTFAYDHRKLTDAEETASLLS